MRHPFPANTESSFSSSFSFQLPSRPDNPSAGTCANPRRHKRLAKLLSPSARTLMAARHDPNKPNRAYFEQTRVSTPLPPLPLGYDWKKQIQKYSPKRLLMTVNTEPLGADGSIKTDTYYRYEINTLSQPRQPKSNLNRLSGVFCHRGFYDQAMKIPENSVLAIDHGFKEYGFCLHELDVKLHANAGTTPNPLKAFLSHDATGARTTAQSGRWSQIDGRDVIGTPLVTKGINLEKMDFASTFQETDAKVPGLARLLFDYDRRPRDGRNGPEREPLLPEEIYADGTFQLDVSQPGDAFARILAYFRNNEFRNLQVIFKGYNRFYSNGPALLEAVNTSLSHQSGVLIDTFRAHDEPVISVAYGYSYERGGRLKIATGSRDNTVRIWDSHTNTLERTLVGHDGAVNSVAFSHEYEWVVSGSQDNTVRLWDFDTGNLIHSLRGHKGAVNSVAFSDKHMLVASASDDGKVLLWDAKSGELRSALKGYNAPVTSVAFSEVKVRVDNQDRRVVSGSYDGMIRIWDSSTGKLLHTLSGHTNAVTSMVIDSNLMATGSLDKTVRIWDISSKALLYTLQDHKAPVTSVAFDRGRMRVASASGKMVKIWHVEGGRPHLMLSHKADVTSVKFGNAHRTSTIITASRDGEVRVYAYGDSWDKFSADYPDVRKAVIIVFYPQPILGIALEGKGLAVETTTPEERLGLLDYEYLMHTTMEHIRSFIDNPIPGFGPIIPEVVHCGVGLGYDTRRGTAVNPKDGSRISDPEVLLASRLDRAMIVVNLKLRKLYPKTVFSSCTRLSDVYFSDSDAEYVADLQTGRLKLKLAGEHGIPARLRTIHGGLYPQSDLVVADDPFAEIAARTWIDEYARLDRAQLMNMTYDDWIAQDPAVKEVVDGLNAKFWPNTVGRIVGGTREQEGIKPAENQGERKEGDNKAKGMSPVPQPRGEGKRKWWKKF